MSAATIPNQVTLLSHLLLAFQMSLGIVFLLSAWTKLRSPLAFARSVAEYKILPAGAARGLALALILVEAFLAIAFLTGWLVRVALLLAALLLILFFIAVALNLIRGRQIACGCFGDANEQISNRTLARLILLLIVVLLLLVPRNTTIVPSLALSLILFDNLMIIYLLQTIVLALFFILAGSWLLQLPELILLARYGYRHYFSPGNTES
jgi:putative oxidoreductase